MKVTMDKKGCCKRLILMTVLVLTASYFYVFEIKFPNINQNARNTEGIFSYKFDTFNLLKYFRMQLEDEKGLIQTILTKETLQKQSTIQTNLTKETIQKQSTIWQQINCKENECRLQSLTQEPTQRNSSRNARLNNTICPSLKESYINANVNTISVNDVTKTVKCEIGGKWRPDNCTAKQKVAILVPYRARASMLGVWLRHIHWFLQKQNIEYSIFIIEQDNHSPFNRAALLNIGAKYAMKSGRFDCLFIHDIDQLPTNLQNLYVCNQNPMKATQHARQVSCRKRPPYKNHFGLVTSLTPSQFLSVNGYSNLYFGWGAEDDDMSLRLRTHGYQIATLPGPVGSYLCLKHTKQSQSNDRSRYIKTARDRIKKDGFNSQIYDLLAYSELPLFTWIYVHIDKEKVRNHFWKGANKQGQI